MRLALFICKYFWHKWVPGGKFCICQRCGAELNDYIWSIYAEDHNTVIGHINPVGESPMEVYLRRVKKLKEKKC